LALKEEEIALTRMISGSCLCNAVTFEMKEEITMFYLCHCKQCQKITGSGFAANLFTHPHNIRWLTGEASLQRYDDPERDFTKVFCSKCGSGLPFTAKSGKCLIVPAGCLDRQPAMAPKANIFWSERMPWYENLHAASCFQGFPT
jgi:hypothetical protein